MDKGNHAQVSVAGFAYRHKAASAVAGKPIKLPPKRAEGFQLAIGSRGDGPRREHAGRALR